MPGNKIKKQNLLVLSVVNEKKLIVLYLFVYIFNPKYQFSQCSQIK